MELAVLLAAGLRDWIDFGVIVRMLNYLQQKYHANVFWPSFRSVSWH